MAFNHVDELCADGPVVLCADDAHFLDAASLTLLRRLAWASQSLPLALLINTRPSPSRGQLTMLIRQAQIKLWLPAALVRDGLTNREIGTRLFVSPRTVQTHVSHILQKTPARWRCSRCWPCSASPGEK